MALISPGVQVTVIDESNYNPGFPGTIPFVVVATAQDKTNPSGNVAEFTTENNAGKMLLVTSQRELVSKFGKPNFEVLQGTPIHGSELNEYGLLAAYSALGVSNAAWIMRADVDLAQLAGSLARPTGGVQNNTLWLDTEATSFGMFEWNSSTGFQSVLTTNATGTRKLHVITDTDFIDADFPVSDLGKPGDYAVDATDVNNPVFYKAAAPSPEAGNWLVVGSSDWFNAHPAVVGTATNPTVSGNLTINSSNVVLTSANISVVAANINGASISGITAAATSDGRLALYNTNSGAMTLANGSGTPLTSLGIAAGSYNRPAFVASKHTQAPAGGVWTPNGSDPRPTGSVWFKTTTPNRGARFVVKRYNSSTKTWTDLTTPVYPNDAQAIYELDQAGGGINIAANRTYIQSDIFADNTFTYKLFVRQSGVSRVTGSVANPVFAGSTTYTFTIRYTTPGSNALGSPVTVSFTTAGGGGTYSDFVTAVNNAGLPNISAARETTGRITLTHATGGVMQLANGANSPLTVIGVTTTSPGARESDITAGAIWVSNWLEATYTINDNEPAADPADGTYWYFNNVEEYDILINDGTQWRGYLNGGTDSRGYNLSLTNAEGPLVSASEPTEQSDGTALVNGDLWINTSNLEDFPKIYRYQNNAWVELDVTDQTSENGIVFADARWGLDGTEDVIIDDVPTITSLLTSDYVDSDCPSYALYPRGILLFNTRRSGMNVKEFVVNHFANDEVPPSYVNAWVSASGNDVNGTAYLGRKAQHNLVVSKMIAAVSNSSEALEEARFFNLIAAPAYPELTSTLTQLNVNRKETAFILVDAPFRLESSSNTLDSWARNLNLATENGEEGFVSYYEYMAGYYPSGLSRDLDGNQAVVPASHMTLRTYIRSDQKSYPWFAPAGLRRGVVDNATAIGYIDAQSGEFQSIAVNNNLRDVLYEGKVNPISVLVGSGIVVYGQKTRSSVTSALDRVNVARLIVYLRRQLDLIARPFIFEPNDEITRKEIKAQIEKELISIKANRGLYDFAVLCDLSNNTQDRIDRNELWVDVAIEPVKAIEFIYIPVRIKNTGDIAAGL